MPEFAVIDLPQELVIAEQVLAAEEIPIAKGGSLVQSGLCFGTRFIENASHPGPAQMSRLSNADTIPGVVVFDTWVGNWDRNEGNTNLLVSPSVGTAGWFDFHLIDFSVIIARRWRIGHLNNMITPVWFYGRNPYFEQYLRVKDGIIPHLDNLRTLPLAQIESVVNSVPDEWGLQTNEADALIRFLDQRREGVAAKMQENLPCLRA